ncbi:hypothetical protein D3C81_1584000 [compost metagenome]
MAKIRTSHNFAVGKAQHVRTGRVDKGYPSFGIKAEYALGDRIEDQGVIVAQLLNLLGIPDALGNITGNPVNTDNFLTDYNRNIGRI